MKKLIIAAAIVCVAAMSQAASIAWSSTSYSLTDKDGTVLRDAASLANIVLVNLGSTADFSSVTTAQIIPTGTGTAPGHTTMSINTATNSKGGRLSGTVYFTYNGETSDLVHNGDYLALMVQDGDTLSQLVYSSGASAGEKVDATYQVAGLSSNSSSLTGKAIAFSGNFYASTAVPEPTSAMLVLLGVAGLSLRRRRA